LFKDWIFLLTLLLIGSFFVLGFAGFLRMNSLSKIGEAEGFIRFFSIYVWNGFCV
jgi:hypothetical protein